VARFPRSRFPGVARVAALLALSWMAACAACSGASRDLDSDLGGLDVADGQDLPEASDVKHDGLGDDGSPADVPKTCENQLLSWLCLDAAHCQAWEECTGPQACDQPPCWGDYCQDFPGTCIPKVFDVPCTLPSDCASGQSCPVAEAGGANPHPAACRALPVAAGTCWSDLDCVAGQRCAGETLCAPDNLGACSEFPGRCAPAPVGSNCLEDDDCGVAGSCSGAVLCSAAQSDCADVAGTCASGGRKGCLVKADCKDDPAGPFCVGARLEAAGFCSPAPGLHGGECWEDADCGQTGACIGAAPCPPGDRCQAGALHAGFCGPFPTASTTGVVVTFVAGATRADDRAVIHNLLPIAIAYPACQSLGLQIQKNGAWLVDADGHPSTFNGKMDDTLCVASNPSELLRIPSGGARVLVNLQADFEVPNHAHRLVLVYHIGCDSADAASEGCRVQDYRFVTSADFQ